MSVNSAAQQLYTFGPIDNYLFGDNPDTDSSIFALNSSKISPFAKNVVKVNFDDTIDYGKIVMAKLPLVGDLVNSINLHIKLPTLKIPPGSTFVAWTNSIGYVLIDYVQVLIGGFVVSHQTGESMELLDYLSTDGSKKGAKAIATGRYDNINVLSQNATKPQDLYIPLQFWFNKKLGSSLPIVALSKHQVQLVVKFNDFSKCVSYDGPLEPTVVPLEETYFVADYYLLSPVEKSHYKDESLTYLIEEFPSQHYNINQGLVAKKLNINMAKSIKELLVVFREKESVKNNDFFNYGLRSKQGQEFVKTIQLLMNGIPRFEKMSESYLRLVTPQKHHTFSGNRNIYVIPFSEVPESNQPTGSINFTLYDNIELNLELVEDLPNSEVIVYGIAYNVLEIKNGIAHVKFLS